MDMSKENVLSALRCYAELIKRTVKSLKRDECYRFELIEGVREVFNSKIMPLLAGFSVARIYFIDESDGFGHLASIKQIAPDTNPNWTNSQN